MPTKPTKSKTVRKALLTYSNEHKERSRSRSRDKDKRKKKPDTPQRAKVETREQGEGEQSITIESLPIDESLPQSSDSAAPLPSIEEQVPANEEEAVSSTTDVPPELLPTQEEIRNFEPTGSHASVLGSVGGETVIEVPDTKASSSKTRSKLSILARIRSWMLRKPPPDAEEKDRLSTVEEGKEENDSEVQDEESPTIANLVKSSVGALASVGSFLPDEEAIIIVSDKGLCSTRNVEDVVVDSSMKPEPSVSTGTAEKSDLYEHPLHKRRKQGPAWFSSMPKYSIAAEMKDGDKTVQTRFIQKIFSVYLLKTLAILAVVRVVSSNPRLSEIYVDEEMHLLHFISVGFYIMEKFIVRMAAKMCRKLSWLHYILLLLEIAALCDIASFLLMGYLTDEIYLIAINKILYSIAMASLYFLIVGYFVTFDMRDQIMMGAAIIITAAACFHQVIHNMTIGVHPEHFDHRSRWYDELTCTAAALGVAECIIMIIMWDLQRILTGHRIPNVVPNDWLITSVYLI